MADKESEPGEQEPEEGEQSKTSPAAGFFAFLFLAVIAALSCVVLYRIYPGTVQHKADPGWLDNIFGTNLVVFAARLVLFSAALVLAFVAAYVIWSIIQWMKQGQLLTRAGPFEVSQQAITELREEVDFWQGSAVDSNAEVQALRQQLEKSDTLIDQLYEAVREHEQELERFREEGEGT